MYPRTEYEMSTEDLSILLNACKPVVAIKVGNYVPSGPQENANRAWALLGKKMGFDPMTVRPVDGKGQRFFTAVPSETESQKQDRLKHEEDQSRREEIDRLKAEINEKQNRLVVLKEGK